MKWKARPIFLAPPERNSKPSSSRSLRQYIFRYVFLSLLWSSTNLPKSSRFSEIGYCLSFSSLWLFLRGTSPNHRSVFPFDTRFRESSIVFGDLNFYVKFFAWNVARWVWTVPSFCVECWIYVERGDAMVKRIHRKWEDFLLLVFACLGNTRTEAK